MVFWGRANIKKVGEGDSVFPDQILETSTRKSVCKGNTNNV